MLSLNPELHLAALTNPMVFAFNERVIMNTFAIVRGADVAFHTWLSLRLERDVAEKRKPS
jgi:hypothetical protein